MSCSRCQTINLAKVSVNTLRCNAKKLQKIPVDVGRSEKCGAPKRVPPPPRNIRPAKIQVCRPRAVEFVHPPVPCICPPCPICPSPAEHIRKLISFSIKFGIFYFLFEAATKEEVWGNPDGSARAMSHLSSALQAFTSNNKESRDHPSSGNSPGLVHMDSLKFKLATYWDKAIVLFFKWTIGVPLQVAHDAYQSVQGSIAGDDDEDED